MSNFRWVVLLLSIASLGWACGDKGDGGSSNDNICDKRSESYDEAACSECLRAYSACTGEGTCDSEDMEFRGCAWVRCDAQYTAVSDCAHVSYGACSTEHPDDDDAADACMESACSAKHDALNACGRANCSAEDSQFEACIRSQCPGAAACVTGLME